MDCSEKKYPVGARVVIRDEEWRITGVEETTRAGARLRVKGVSDLVRGKNAIFYTKYEGEDAIRILKPEETALFEDTSAGFIRSKLYLEALFRTAPKTDPERIEVADRAAMDPLPYQFDPALAALKRPRARILIADAVGIGKTLEAGILASELIARGRGRRILVLATKAMLSQFQQEFWNRFSIPLVRLDSAGIQRVRSRLPSNHNPFLYFDRSIISIDTLKQDSEYRHFLETARWDIIVIDEAHNVAVRSGQSQRAKLAQLLASRSDTMILLSATPHDGKPESFASLLNILDPTAIPDPSHYRLEDFAKKGLVVRRFKKDVAEQVKKSFPDRVIRTEEVAANPEEEAVLSCLKELRFSTLDHTERTGARLFSTTLAKAFYSSPAACRSVIRHRVAKLEKQAERPGAREDIGKLLELDSLVSRVTPEKFGKLARLAALMKGEDPAFDWKPSDTKDRLVVFTESVETLEFLKKELPKRAGLKPNQVIDLSGKLPDSDIMTRVNEFNNGESPARLLLCSDVASEGINLHHFAHRMIHFDIPWSLMTFQQRNGRIDRYGQTEQPQILYLQTVSANDRAAGDARVLERLIEKDRMVHENLMDPAELLATAEEQEAQTAAEIEAENPWADFFMSAAPAQAANDADGKETQSSEVKDVMAALSGADPAKREASGIAPVTGAAELARHLAGTSPLFGTDMKFAQAALKEIAREEELGPDALQILSPHRVLLSAEIADLKARLRGLPPEVLPENREFDLTDDRAVLEKEMVRARASGDAWPQMSLLWALHPVMLWLEDRLSASFGRHSAPVLRLGTLKNGETWALLQGGYPNRRGYIPVHRWVAVQMKDGKLAKHTLRELIRSLSLPSPLSNRAPEGAGKTDLLEKYRDFVNEAVKLATEDLKEARCEFEAKTKAKLEAELSELAKLREEHFAVIAERYEGENATAPMRAKAEERRRVIDRNFKDAERYVRDTAETEEEPSLTLAAIFAPADH